MNEIVSPLQLAIFDGVLRAVDFRLARTHHLSLQINWQLVEAQAADIAEQSQKKFEERNGQRGFVQVDHEPTIDQLHTDIYGLLLEHLAPRHAAFQAELTAAFSKLGELRGQVVWRVTSTTQAEADVVVLASIVRDLFAILALQIHGTKQIIEKQLGQFLRPAFREWLELGSEKEKWFRGWLFATDLIGLARGLVSLATSIQEGQLEPAAAPAQESQRHFFDSETRLTIAFESDRINPAPSGSNIFTKSAPPRAPTNPYGLNKLLRTITKQTEFHLAFIESTRHLVCPKYFQLQIYHEYFQKFMRGDNGPDDFQRNLSEIPRCDEVASRPQESPVECRGDMVLVLLHFVTILMNVGSLGMSIYLSAFYLNVDLEKTGALQAAYPFGAFIFGFFWYRLGSLRNYKPLFLTSIFFNIVSNLLYYMASMTVSPANHEVNAYGIVMLEISRVFLGAGIARPLLFKYFTFMVKRWAQQKFALLLIILACVGQCLGPGIQALLLYIDFGPTGCRPFGGTRLCQQNVIALFFMLFWGLIFLLFLFFYQGLERNRRRKSTRHLFGLFGAHLASRRFAFRLVPPTRNDSDTRRRLRRHEIIRELVRGKKEDWLTGVDCSATSIIQPRKPESIQPKLLLEARPLRPKSLDEHALQKLEALSPLALREKQASLMYQSDANWQLVAISQFPEPGRGATPRGQRLSALLSIWNNTVQGPQYSVCHPVRNRYLVMTILFVVGVT